MPSLLECYSKLRENYIGLAINHESLVFIAKFTTGCTLCWNCSSCSTYTIAYDKDTKTLINLDKLSSLPSDQHTVTVVKQVAESPPFIDCPIFNIQKYNLCNIIHNIYQKLVFNKYLISADTMKLNSKKFIIMVSVGIRRLRNTSRSIVMLGKKSALIFSIHKVAKAQVSHI